MRLPTDYTKHCGNDRCAAIGDNHAIMSTTHDNLEAPAATVESTPRASNFIRDIVIEDLKTNKFNGRVQTRFPPEPNGYLHIGHAKST